MLTKHIQLLVENREKLRFFFPLCGKALDMKWVAYKLDHDVCLIIFLGVLLLRNKITFNFIGSWCRIQPESTRTILL